MAAFSVVCYFLDRILTNLSQYIEPILTLRLFYLAMRPTLLFLLLATSLSGHDLITTDREILRAHILDEWKREQVKVASIAYGVQVASVAVANAANAPQTAKAFLPFAKLDLRADAEFLYVGSNGLPDHNMMVGITAWQQQVPLPQKYFDDNAWRIPLHPVPAKEPVLIKGRFLRGAIALAVNGVPIFNPQNNRGEVSQEIGELDQWGGHCGRGDDYHYHAAPFHLQTVVGKGMPIAYALDGYPIYGLTEPDGSPVGKLDVCHGHETAGVGYHYHGSTQYPYVIGGFHGEVVEAGGQVDPQPRANPVRPDTPPLRGAVITGFEMPKANTYKLSYRVGGDQRAITYSVNEDSTYPFEYDNGREGTTTEVYTARRGGGVGGPDGAKGRAKGKGKSAPSASVDAKGEGAFVLSSPVVVDNGELPPEYTGDGEGATLPLTWKGAPVGTMAYALIMDHADRDGKMKWYWTLYDLPGNVTTLAKNAQGIGKTGTGFKGQVGYEPPHSKGPGAKTYTLTLFALSAPLNLDLSPREVNRESLLTAMKGKILATSSLRVIHTSQADPPPAGERFSRDRGAMTLPFPQPFRPISAPLLAQSTQTSPKGDRASSGKAKGKGKGGPPGLIKPSLADTMKLNVYADNWFMLYVNGRLVAVDPIPFTPHNVVSVDFLPEYPMTIAVLAKDNADPKTGMEYGSSIGDGGFILKFGDGTVTNATWKAKNFFHSPVNGNTDNPKVIHDPLPANWWAVAFDDSAWKQAKEYSVEEVDPKRPWFEHDFEGAKFIWSENLALDNTIIFRTKIDKPGWTPRWNTKPDLDVTSAPLK